MALVLNQFILLLLWSKTFDIDIKKIHSARARVCVTLLHKTQCEILQYTCCVYSCRPHAVHDTVTDIFVTMCQKIQRLHTVLVVKTEMPLSYNIDFGFEWLPWFYMVLQRMHHHGFIWYMVPNWLVTTVSHNPKMLVWWVKLYFILASFFFFFLKEYLLRK